ncbi:MAG: hypothetical protein RMK84_16155 [Oscillochloridaceae bacterium]|nr:hypothetical protein [Chloroflexaceae bacterium]MDW8391659.1 hypothetical protein [Oscillochloridaceae bacterium]
MTMPASASLSRRALLVRALLAAGVLALLLGAIWGGLLRLGWALPTPRSDLAALHGPLFVCGMLGTVIGLERAVALGRPWAFSGPLLAMAGGLGLLAGLPASLGALLITAGSLGLLLVFAVLVRRQPARFVVTMALGAAAWLVGNLLWLVGRPLAVASFWWAGFLVLTILGERLELGRLRQLPARALRIFVLGVATLLLGLGATPIAYGAGARLSGAGFVILGLWLLAFDIARRTVRRAGLPRFTAVCILSGSVWLAVAGGIALSAGAVYAGPVYDALLHAVFVGFVFAMIFGHAPIIIPALLQIPLAFNRWSYLPLVALHLSLLLRVAGDLTLRLDLRRWGGMLNALAIALFLLLTLASALRARRQPKHSASPSETPVFPPSTAGIDPATARNPDDGRIIKEVQDGRT